MVVAWHNFTVTKTDDGHTGLVLQGLINVPGLTVVRELESRVEELWLNTGWGPYFIQELWGLSSGCCYL